VPCLATRFENRTTADRSLRLVRRSELNAGSFAHSFQPEHACRTSLSSTASTCWWWLAGEDIILSSIAGSSQSRMRRYVSVSMGSQGKTLLVELSEASEPSEDEAESSSSSSEVLIVARARAREARRGEGWVF